MSSWGRATGEVLFGGSGDLAASRRALAPRNSARSRGRWGDGFPDWCSVQPIAGGCKAFHEIIQAAAV